MQTPLNPFKLALSGGTTQIGLWLGLADPCAAELCATAGFDWLLIDGEHGPNDLRSVLAVLQAVAPYPSQPVVRIPHGDAALIKQVLEIGATTLLVPMVESAEQARQLVRAMRYPRAGFRGVGSGLARSSRWSAYPNYLKEANDSLCLLVQVETAAALEQIDAIAAVDETLARRYIELGARFVAVGVEATMLAQAARALATRFKGAAGHGPGDRRTSNGY